ncbi:MAG: BatD family protein [Clostridiales bacterium]|nr:BatD family protein [Clostridiales bacterium]
MVKRITLAIIVAIVASAVVTTIAQTVKVQAPRSVVEGSMFHVVYELENASASNIQVGKIDGCTELSGPAVTSSSSITIIQGQRTEQSTTGYAYTYRAVKAGTYTIPAATLTVNGKEVKSQPTQIKVLPPDSNPTPGNNGNGQPSNPATQTPQTGQNISSNDIFVRIIFNKSHVYEGEAVECTLKLYTRYNSISGIQPHKLPTFDGFLIEEVQLSSQNNEIEHYNGQNYLTAVLKKYIIYPQTSGQLTVTSGEYTVGVTTMQRVQHGFWGYTNIPVEQDVNLTPKSSTINITPLPSPKPTSFNGAVGKFTLESRLSSNSLRTNEAASLTTIITGSGNIKYVKAPHVDLPIDFEQYTPSEDVRAHISGNTMTGTVTSELTFVPQSVGTFNVAPIEFSYFDPTKKEYVTLTTGGYDLDVAKGASTTVSNVEQNEIKQRATDILHIHRLDPRSLSQHHSLTIHSPRYWTAWVIVALLALTGIAMYRRQLRLNADVVGRRTARAGRVAKKRLRRARLYMNSGDKEQFHAEILNALWGYISDRLVIPVADLTRSNVSEKLAARGMSQQNIDKIIDILDECEMARYTPDASQHTLQEIYDATSSAMDTLESMKKMKSN